MNLPDGNLWEDLVNKAYTRWQKGGDLEEVSSEEFLDELDPLTRKAVILGNLNYQVGNGGFVQWVDNGYASCQMVQLKRILTKMDTELSKKTLTLIAKVEPLIIIGAKNRGMNGEYWQNETDAHHDFRKSRPLEKHIAHRTE